MLMLMLSIGIAWADDVPQDGIFVWVSGSATCYQLQDFPTVTYSEVGGVTNAVLTLQGKGTPELTLPLTEGATLEVVYGTYVESPSLAINAYGLATFSFSLPIRITGGADAYKVAYGTEPNTLVCTQIPNNEVPAYTGILLKGTTENAPVSYTVISEAAEVTGNILKPTTTSEGLAAKESALVLKDNQFVTYTGTAFKPNRAYIPYSSDTKDFTLIFDGEQTTSISVPATPNQVQKVGKYIIGGRVVIVRDGKQYNTDGALIK